MCSGLVAFDSCLNLAAVNKGAKKMGRGIAVFLFFALLLTYIVIVLVPAISQAGGIPPNFLSLIWPPALMVIGYSCLSVFGAMAKKKAEEK
jgi:hypothetical protein